MLAEKIKKTLVLSVFVCVAALVADYVSSDIVLKTPEIFNPFKTLAIALSVCIPVGFYLISQRLDVQSVKSELLASIQRQEIARLEAEKANALLKASEALYKLLADNQTDMISLWAEHGGNLYTSPSAERHFGFTDAERRALGNYSNIHPEDMAMVGALPPTVTLESGPVTAEFRVLQRTVRLNG